MDKPEEALPEGAVLLSPAEVEERFGERPGLERALRLADGRIYLDYGRCAAIHPASPVLHPTEADAGCCPA